MLVSCGNTSRDREIAELRKELEQARAEAAAARAEAAAARAMAQRDQLLYEQALALESQGRGAEAVKLYVRAARSGSGKAALRVAQIYEKGILGVSRDFAEALKWYNAARILGEEVPLPAR